MKKYGLTKPGKTTFTGSCKIKNTEARESVIKGH